MASKVLLTFDELNNVYDFGISKTKQKQYETFIKQATEACLDYIHFNGETKTLYFNGSLCKVFSLGYKPVKELSLFIDESRKYTKKLASDQYRLDEETSMIYLYCDYPTSGRDVMKVIFNIGYDSDTVPEQIKACIAMTVQHLARLIKTNQVGVSAKTTDGGSESVEQALLPLAVQRTLDKYRIFGAR